jgi:hypothetical protein
MSIVKEFYAAPTEEKRVIDRPHKELQTSDAQFHLPILSAATNDD